MRAALAYAPRPGPLGSARPAVAACFLAPLAVIAFSFSHPLVLAACLAAAVLVAAASAALRATLGAMRFGAYLAVSVIVINGIVSQRGETVLLRGGDVPLLARVDISLEALAEGGVLALRIVAALAIFAAWSACVDPDRVLRGIRPWAARSALTATLIGRLVPLAAADSTRLAEAARLRGPAARPVGRAALARRLLAGSLDRAVDVAATLELRGYGLEVPPRRQRSRLRPGEVSLLLAGALTTVAAVGAALAGIAEFSAYPTIEAALDPATLAFAAALPALALAPFASHRRGAAPSGPGPAPGPAPTPGAHRG